MTITITDPYTAERQLCDNTGLVSDQRVEPGSPGTLLAPDLTYRQLLNNLRRHGGQEPYTGKDFRCTGNAHLAGEHFRCTSPAHTTPTPWTAEQLAELLPPDAKIEPSRWGIHADWTTTAGTWTLTASWHTHRATHIAIHGPRASTTLTDPTANRVQACLAALGALNAGKPVACPHPGCPTTTDFVESMDHHLDDHDEAVQAWRADTAEGQTER